MVHPSNYEPKNSMTEKHSPRLVKHKASKVLMFHDKKHIEKEADNYVKLTNQ